MPLSADAGRWLRHRLTEEGPAELFGLMRILAVLVTWSRLGAAMVPHSGMETWGLLVSVLFWVSTSAMFLGLGARVASALTAASVYLIYVDHPLFGDEHLRSHHVMAQGLVCLYLALTPCDRAFVLGRPLSWGERGPLWGLHLMRLQLAVMYVGATWEKAYGGWMSGARMEQILMRVFTGSDPLSLPWRALAFAIANGTVLVEGALALAPLLVRSDRTRWATYAVAVGFHGLVYALTPVSTFSATMAVWWLAILPVEGVHQLVGRLLADDAPHEEASAGWAPFAVGAVVLVGLLLAGPFTRWLPDRSGFEELGEDVCVVTVGEQVVAGARPDVKPQVCKAGPLSSARCVVDGRWEDVDRDVVCAPVPRGPRRRVPAR